MDSELDNFITEIVVNAEKTMNRFKEWKRQEAEKQAETTKIVEPEILKLEPPPSEHELRLQKERHLLECWESWSQFILYLRDRAPPRIPEDHFTRQFLGHPIVYGPTPVAPEPIAPKPIAPTPAPPLPNFWEHVLLANWEIGEKPFEHVVYDEPREKRQKGTTVAAKLSDAPTTCTKVSEKTERRPKI